MSDLLNLFLPKIVSALKLFPPELVALTIIFVIIPSIISVLLRISLYQHLKELNKKVNKLLDGRGYSGKLAIVEDLEKRFSRANEKLENVNTTALVDGAYTQEKFNFLGLRLYCEQWDYFCRVLPNLLLAFGLLGTFLGITLNLYNLAQVINQANAADVNSLIQKLQEPLQSMGIAFITSLMALIASSFLTLVNLRYNTNIAKFSLINSLEDYLDNIYQPTVPGHSRLDQAISRMVESQEQFLTRFHEKVGQVLEKTFGDAVNKIVEQNEQSQKLARQVYERLIEASGSLSSGAITFKQSVDKIVEIVPPLEESTKILARSVIVFNDATEKLEKCNFSDNLEKVTANLFSTQKDFADSSALLSYKLMEFIDSNSEAISQVNKVYGELQKYSNSVQESSKVLLQASLEINQSKFAEKLSSAASDLAISHNQFASAVSVLNNTSKTMDLASNNFNFYTEKLNNVGEGVNKLSQQYIKINDQLEKRLKAEATQLDGIQAGLNQFQEYVSSSFNNLMDKLFGNKE